MAADALAFRKPEPSLGRRLGRLGLGFWLAILVLALTGVALAFALRGWSASQALAERLNDALVQSESLLSQLKDAETGQRGYLLTLDERYLEPYRGARPQIDATRARLRELLGVEPGMAGPLQRIEGLVAERERQLAATVGQVRAGDVAGALAFLRSGEGKATMDRIRAEVAALQGQLHARLGAEQRGYRRSIFGLSALALASSALACLYLAVKALQRRRKEEQARALLGGVLANSPTGLGIFDRELRLRHANPALLRMGLGLEGLAPGASLWQLAGGLRQRLEPVVRAVLGQGRVVTGIEIAGGAPESPRHFLTSYFPLPGERGEIDGLGVAVVEITRLKAAAREQQEKATLLEALGVGVYGMDAQGRCTFVNEAALQAIGYAREEVIGRDMHGLTHHTYPDGTPYPQAECPLLRSLAERRPARLDNEMLWRKDGSFFMAECSAFPMLDGEAVLGAVVTFQDVSRRRLAQRRLALQFTVSRILAGSAEVEAALAQALAAIGSSFGWVAALFWATGEEGEALHCRATWAAPEADAAALLALAREAPLARGSGLAGRVWAAGAPEQAQDLAAGADGPWREAMARAGVRAAFAFPVRGGEEEVLGVVELLGARRLEIDEGLLESVRTLGRQIGQFLLRRRFESALQQSEALFRTLANSIPQLAWMAGPSGAITWYNQRWYDYTGATPEEMAGWGWKKAHHPDHVERVAESISAAFRAGEPWEDTFPLRGRDGEYRWFLSRALPLRDERGRVLGWFGTNTDITEQKRVEEELAAAKAQAEEANRAKSQFIANMSHELRTPLSAVIGYAEMLEEEVAELGQPTILEDLRKIHGNARHLLALINDVLDLSKIEAGKMEAHPERFDVAKLLAEVARTVGALAQKKGNRLELEVGPGLGEMRSDLVKVRQILFNLLSNAAKFTENGTITLRAAREGDALLFEVRDTGIGMSEEQQARLFQRFNQADPSTTRRYGGTGLGLAITKAFCALLGGEIAVASRPGEGSAFTVRLPADLDGAAAAPAEPAAELRPGEGESLALVIDDDPPTRELLGRFLAREGFATRAAADGRAGLELARALRPAVILLDVMMPHMDGWSVLSALKADPELADIPVIMVSMVGEKGLGYALGAAEYLTKPIEWPRLKRALGRHRPSQGPPSVLLVEDEAATRERLRSLLTREGWAVAEAENGRVALERLALSRPALILLDLLMPELDGFELIQELRRRPEWRAIPVVVVTAKDLTRAEIDRLNGQVRQVVRKDCLSLDELAGEIRRLVGRPQKGVPG